MGSAKKNKKPKDEPEKKASVETSDDSDKFWSMHPHTFHALVAGPPVALLSVVMPPRQITTWFAIWALFQYTPLNHSWSVAGSRALTIYGAWLHLRESLFPHAEDGSVLGVRLAAACGVGLLMGVAYRNVMQALDWLVSDFPERPTSDDGECSEPPRALSTLASERAAVRISLRQGTSAGKLNLDDAAPVPNTHGAAEFIVKVQLPMAAKGGDAGMGMVYDERRTFQAFVDLESDSEPHVATLTRMIATKGAAGGLKGFFNAKRDGDDLLVFVDRVLRPCTW